MNRGACAWQTARRGRPKGNAGGITADKLALVFPGAGLEPAGYQRRWLQVELACHCGRLASNYLRRTGGRGLPGRPARFAAIPAAPSLALALALFVLT